MLFITHISHTRTWYTHPHSHFCENPSLLVIGNVAIAVTARAVGCVALEPCTGMAAATASGLLCP